MTIKKIAKLAGVSIGTVDRVVHNRGRVSENTVKRVNELIKKHGYKPNIFASNLSLSKTYTFGVLIPKISQDSNYWSIPVKGMENAQNELSIYKIHIKFFYFDRHDELSFKKAWKNMIKSDIDGLIIAPVFTALSKNFIINELNNNMPLVFFDSYIPEIHCISFIGQDSFQSGVLSAKLMKMAVCRPGEIAVIRVIPEDFHIIQRANGFNEYFKDQNEYLVKTYDVYNSDDNQEFCCIISRIINENKNLTGIFITNASTHYAAKNLKSLILKNRVSLIGYDLIHKNIQYLKDGTIDFLISQRPEHQGYQSVYALYQYIVLKKKTKNKIMLPIDIITKENINYYIE